MFGPINNIWPGGSEEIYFKSTDNKWLVIYGELKKKRSVLLVKIVITTKFMTKQYFISVTSFEKLIDL